MGGNLTEYPYEPTTRTADLTTSKILWNSVISTPGARFAAADIENFYLNTPMARYEYMCMHISLIPDEIIEAYTLLDNVVHGPHGDSVHHVRTAKGRIIVE